MCAINNGSERVLQSLVVQLRPQASGNRAVADKPNDSIVASDNAYTTLTH